MPYSYRIDAALETAFVTLRGEVTADDLRGFRQALLSDPEWKPGYGRLVEFSGNVALSVTAQEVSQTAWEGVSLRERFGRGKLAIVAPGDLEFGIARMYTTSLEGSPHPRRLFRDRESALEWLGLADPEELD
jgi:hypothetical protein